MIRAEQAARSGQMAARFWVWLAATVVGSALIGTGALVAVAYASSATGVGAEEREIVIGAVLLLLCAGSLGLVAVIGQVLGVARPSWAGAILPAGIGCISAMLGYWLALETRRGAALDVDNIGMAVLLPILLLIVSVSVAAASWATDASRLGWLAIAGTAAAVFVIGVSVLFFNASFPGAWSAGVALVSAAVAVLAVVSVASPVVAKPART
jgi:hypothetical protein